MADADGAVGGVEDADGPTDQGGGDGLFRLYHERQAGGDGEFRSFYDRQGR